MIFLSRTRKKLTVIIIMVFLLSGSGAVFYKKFLNLYKADDISTTNTAHVTITIPELNKQVSGNLFSSNLQISTLIQSAVNRETPQAGIYSQFEDKIKDLNVQTMRLNSGEGWYRWFKSIGPMSYRKANPTVNNYGTSTIGYFGIDDYITETSKLNVKDIMISVNYAGGLMPTYDSTKKALVGTYVSEAGAQEAANWVEYCNGKVAVDSDTSSWGLPVIDKTAPGWDPEWGAKVKPAGYFAWLRAQPTFGNHPEPYNVKYWEIGNEVYWGDRYLAGFGDQSDGGATVYGEDLVVFSQKMKAVDPTIKIGAVVVEDILTSNPNWNSNVINPTTAAAIDFLSIHMYDTLRGLDFARMYSASQSVTRTVNVTSDGTHRFQILARGQSADEGNGMGSINPILELKVDGNVVQTWDVGLNMQFCDYSGNLSAGNHTIKFTFINDYSNKPTNQDRNLFVYRATLDSEDVLFPEDTEQQWLFYDSKIKNDVLDSMKAKLIQASPGRTIEMMITEGGMGGFDEAPTANGIISDADVTRNQNFGPEHSLRMGSALYLSTFLNTLIERGDVDAYNHWNSFDAGYWGVVRYLNAAGSLKKDSDGVPYTYTTPVYDLLKIYQTYSDWFVLNSSVVSPEYSWPIGIANPTTISSGVTSSPSGVKYIDSLALLSPNSDKMAVILTNRSSEEIDTAVNIQGFKRIGSGSAKQLRVISLGDHSELSDPAKLMRNFDPNFDAHNELETVNSHLSVVPDNVGVQDVLVDISESGVSDIILPADSVTAIEFVPSPPSNPTVSAGPDQVAYPNDMITQTGIIVDEGAGVANYAWAKVSGPGAVSFGSPGSKDTIISADAPGDYIIAFTIVDAASHSAQSTMKLTIKPAVFISPSNFSNGWNMVSFPSTTDTLTSIILPMTFKLRKYDPVSNSYERNENGQIALSTGVGFWMRSDDINKLVNLKYEASNFSTVRASVTKGWNILGNPFQADLPVSHISIGYKDGATKSFAEAVASRDIAGYLWSYEATASPKQYYLISDNPNRYKTDAHKQDYVGPYRGFWMIIKSDNINTIEFRK